ncbi:hypothetical protein Dimus_000792 [Dionaea muscipula]
MLAVELLGARWRIIPLPARFFNGSVLAMREARRRKHARESPPPCLVAARGTPRHLPGMAARRVKEAEQGARAISNACIYNIYTHIYM